MADLYDSLAGDEAAQQKAARTPAVDDVYASMAADEATQRSAQLNASLRTAVPVNPDQAAKVSNLASVTGLPPDVISRNQEEVANRTKVQQLQTLLSASPILARQMADPQFASLAHDDADNLSNFEKTAQQSNASALPTDMLKAMGGPAFASSAPYFSAAGRGAMTDVHKAAAMAGLVASAPAALYGYATGDTRPSDWFASKFIAPHYDALAQIEKEGKNDTFAQKLVSSVAGLGVTLGEIALTGGAAEAPVATTALQVLGNAGMHAIKSMWMPATVDAVDTGKKVYEATGDANKALLAAEGRYVSTTGMGLMPLSTPGGLAVRAGTGFVSGVLGGEVSRSINNATSPASMQTPFSWEDTFLSGATGSLMGAVMGPRAAQSGMAAAIHRAAEDGNKADVTQHQNGTVLSLLGLAEGDKVRERSPENFAQFAQSVAEEGPHPSVFVDARTLADEAQAKGFDIAANMPQTAEQMKDALATNADVRIPLGELTAALPGTGLDQALLPHLRASVDGPTMAEASDKSYAEQTQQQVDQIMQQHEFDTARTASGDAVENELLGQMNTANRFGADVNKVNAKLAADFYRTYSAKLGITPEEMYVRYPLSIQSDEGAGVRTMGQDPLQSGQGADNGQATNTATNVSDAGAGDGLRPGGGSGNAGVAEAQRAATQAAGSAPKLTGLPDKPLVIAGQHYVPGPNAVAHGAAEAYMATTGRDYAPPRVFQPVDPERASRIAQAFDEMQHAPNDPKVKASYDAMIRETLAQWEAIKATGLKIEFIKPGQDDPYAASPRLAIDDVNKNNHLWALPTDTGFGGSESAHVDISGNPLLASTGEVVDGHRMLANDVFRIVHDYFGHIKDGNGFRASGEENAWRSHAAMYSDEARPAMTTETRGQNSWVNFGPYGEQNLKSSAGDTQYAPQKVGLLPDWVVNEGREDRVQTRVTTEPVNRGETDQQLLDMVHPPGENDKSIRAMVDGKEVGHLDLAVGADGRVEAREVRVAPEHRRQGVATRLYDEAKRLGYDVQRSDYQTDDGAAFRDAYDGGKTFNQDEAQRGSMSFGDDITQQPSVMRLLKNADLSTTVHELGHFQLEVMADIAGRADAPPEIKQDMDTILKWFGVDSLESWKAMSTDEQRPYHEQMARGFEKYLFEGKAPSVELKPVFSRIRAWMLNVYKSMQGLNVELSPEVRGVFDRMLASNEQILDAEAQRGIKPLYDSAEAMGATAEEFKAYQEQQQEQTQEAVDQLQSRSLRDMKWLSNAKSRIVKNLQREAKGRREEVQAEVTAEVSKQPVYEVQDFMRDHGGQSDEFKALTSKWQEQRDAVLQKARDDGKAELLAANPDAKGIEKGQLLAKNKRTLDNQAEAVALKWEQDNRRPQPEKRVDLEMVAEAFGFQSEDAMRQAILEAGPKKDAIEGMTDQRMLERYGDLNSPQAIEAAANEALSNEAHLKLLATELRFAERAAGKRSTLVAAAKAFAADIIARKKVSDIRPAMFEAAERKAQAEAQKAHLAGDRQGVADAKRAQLVNAHAAKLAYKALNEIRKGTTYQAKFDKDSIRNKLDVDIRDQIDALRERFDFRQSPPEGPTRAQTNLKEWLESQIAAGYAPLVDANMADPTVKVHYKDMSVEMFRGYVDTLKSLEHIGKERRSITIEGERADLNDYVKNQLVPKIQERGERFTKAELLDKPEDRHTNPIAIALAHFGSWFRSAKAQLKPQEFKRNEYDRHELLGPFGQALFDPVINANYKKVTMLKELSLDFQAKAEELGKDWQKSLHDKVSNDGLMDPDKSTADGSVPMNFTRGKMVGLALHVGNESNFNKVTRGWGWEPAKVWEFLHANMGAKDWDAVQHVWDLYGKHWPEIEEMNRRLGNTTPDRIEPRAFKTEFGELRGGYAAISYDSLRSRRGEKEAAGDAINPGAGLFARNYFRADTTTNGSLNKRVDSYIDRVDLDFHTVAQKLNETIHDLAYRETLIDANKVIEHPDFRREFKAAYGPEAYKSMRDWIGQLANSDNADRQTGALGRALQYTRTGMVINAIAFRLSTVLKHGGSAGFKSLGYFAGGGEGYLASRIASMGTDYTNQITSAQEKFGEIRNRLLQQDRDFRSTSHSLFDPETVISKAERFGHAAVAWSDMMTAVPTAWAAYDRAIAEGIPVSQGGTGKPMTEAQAVSYANKIVREAHGTTAEAGRSMLMNNNSEAIKMFSTLYGFMNNSYGQQLDGFDKLRTAGISNGPVLARTFMAVIIPALWAGWLTHGGKKDDESWGAWIAKAITGEVAASVPFVRDAYSMVEGYKNAGLVPVENLMASLVLAGKDLAHVVQGDGKGGNATKDVLNAVGTGLHIPGLGQVGSTLQYEQNVRSGKEQPKDAGEHALGLVLGHGERKH